MCLKNKNFASCAPLRSDSKKKERKFRDKYRDMQEA